MEGSPPPAVSVIMPVFNRAAVVRQAIGSVLTQHFGDFELIVVDDGSSDGTPYIVAAIEDPRLRLIRLPVNGGGNAARNLGIREARAPLIAFLDSDDAYLPHKLAEVVRMFAERPDLEALVDSYDKVHPLSENRPNTPRRNPVLDGSEELLDALFTRRLWKATPGITVRRDAALRAGLFDETLRRRQDYDFLMRLAGVARCASTDRILWLKADSPDAISSNSDTSLGAILAIFHRHPRFHSDPRFRKGLAIDLAGHFKQRVAARALRRIPADAWPLVRLFGLAGTAALLISGFRMRRERKRQARA